MGNGTLFAWCLAIAIGSYVLALMYEYWIQPVIDKTSSGISFASANIWSALGLAHLHTPIYILLGAIGMFGFAIVFGPVIGSFCELLGAFLGLFGALGKLFGG
jgi:hypothetical protein